MPHSDGVTVTVPPNLLTTKIRAHAPPILTTQGRTGQSIATTLAPADGEAKRSMPCTSLGYTRTILTG
jgi:hypothetical protein